MRDRFHAAAGTSALRAGPARYGPGIAAVYHPALPRPQRSFSMTLTPQQIHSIAQLARLEVKPDEAAAYATSLSSILDMVGQLEKADTAGVEPMAHPLEGQVQRLRADEITSGNQRDLYQRNAPQVEAGLYLVPKVIE
jgi:aspartyl-tRNA(Asn)/glutamyl-tRNA(Gln) amidotransferase subunit C